MIVNGRGRILEPFHDSERNRVVLHGVRALTLGFREHDSVGKVRLPGHVLLLAGVVVASRGPGGPLRAGHDGGGRGHGGGGGGGDSYAGRTRVDPADQAAFGKRGLMVMSYFMRSPLEILRCGVQMT